MTRYTIAGLFVLGFSVAIVWFGHDLMRSHHIRSTLVYGNSSSVEGSRLSLLNSEYHVIGLICHELEADIVSELRVEAAGRSFKVAGLTSREFETFGIPMKKDNYDHGNTRILSEASNGMLSMFFGKDGRLYSVEVRFHQANRSTQTNTVALCRNNVIVSGETNAATIKALLGEPKNRSLSLRIP